MTKLSWAGVAVSMLAVCGTAQADGMAGGSPFTGTYLGVDLGYGWGNANSEHYGNIGFPYGFTQADADIDGVTFGGHIGHNWSIGSNWIFGLEGGLNYSGVEGDDNGSGGDTNEFSANWEGSLTAHIGVAVSPKAMIYALGGYSWLGGDSNVNNPPTESVSDTYGGWKLGAGIEFACMDKMNMRLQYSHTDYDSNDLTFPINLYHMETGPSVDEVSLGLSWRL